MNQVIAFGGSAGGIEAVIVQNPSETKVSEMPATVLRHVETDFCLPVTHARRKR